MQHDRNLLAAAVAISLACSLTASAAFAVLPLEEEARLHLGRWHLGSILGSTSLTFFPACLCAGALATRVGCKRLALGGIFVTAASVTAFGLAEQPASLYAARMIQGVGTAAGQVGIMCPFPYLLPPPSIPAHSFTYAHVPPNPYCHPAPTYPPLSVI